MEHNQNLEGFPKLARHVATEGAVLLKNEHQTLPLLHHDKVAVFGRIQSHYYKSGTGSGGLVNVDYTINILDGLRQSEQVEVDETLVTLYSTWELEHPFEKGSGWGQEPWSQVEMEVSDELVRDVSERNDVALVIIGRTAGEDQDTRNEEGSYLLTKIEIDLIEKVTRYFKRCAVVLNVGNIIDMKWVEEYDVPTVIYVWQGGMEGGGAVADVLCGKVNPSGKLSDTISYELEDIYSTRNFGRKDYNFYREDIYVGYRYFETFAQDRVLYPFGYGLSYTSFNIQILNSYSKELRVFIDVLVTNTGQMAGKEVVQVYVNAPMGQLGKPHKTLVAFKKSELLKPHQSEVLSFKFDLKECASYDDSGVSGHPHCFVLEAGAYHIHVGNSVRHTNDVLTIKLPTCQVVKKLESALAPVRAFSRIKPEVEEDEVLLIYEDVPLRNYDLAKRIQDRKPVDLAYTGDQGYKLSDVAKGVVSMDAFVCQFSDDDLACIVRGEGMSSPKVTPGTASAFGGVTDELLAYGLPVACCADGPSGIRMDCGTHATSLPNGTCMACTWNTSLIEHLYQFEGKELLHNKIDFLLGPGINIHRNPLNGRNFEYFSEDPFLTGSMAIAQLKGMHSVGVSGTLKHFTANNQETARHHIDCIVSERALREIYLKGFEMAVKEAHSRSIMTSYSAINGIWAASNYELNTTILREQWGFTGIVMSDWWAKLNDEGGSASKSNTKAMVRAQNDIYMVVENAKANSNKDNTLEALEQGLLSRGELQRCAKNICEVLLKSEAFARLQRSEEVGSSTTSTHLKTSSQSIKVLEGTTLSLESVDTSAGSEISFELDVMSGDTYRLDFTVQSNLNPLAQLAMNVLVNDLFLTTLVFNGTDGEWMIREKHLGLSKGEQKLTFSFPQNGLSIKSVLFTQYLDAKEYK